MDLLMNFMTSLQAMPLERLLALIAMGVIALAAFALHVVLTVVKQAHPK